MKCWNNALPLQQEFAQRVNLAGQRSGWLVQ